MNNQVIENLGNNKNKLKELLDSLLENGNEDSRIMLAKQGYGLDVLINDKNENVRLAVA